LSLPPPQPPHFPMQTLKVQSSRGESWGQEVRVYLCPLPCPLRQ